MKILFVHQNFPGQYKFIAQYFRQQGKHELVAVTLDGNTQPELFKTIRFKAPRSQLDKVDPLGRHYAQAAARGHEVAKVCLDLKAGGFYPDLILGHSGWGDTLFLRDVFPKARIQAYSEFFYKAEGADVGFDPEFGADDFTSRALTHTKNASTLAGLFSADRGLSPTLWQRSVFPPEAQSRIDVVHDGIDTLTVAPNPQASLALKREGVTLKAGDEVITFVNRNLEPYRGYHVLMRALPAILEARPKARVILVGGDQVSYGRAAPAGKTWRNIFLGEVQGRLDTSRLHFVGRVPYAAYLNILQVSAAHVYLTYPFVLSWSMLEAMAAGCLVVASDTQPVREMIRHGENGLLFGFFDLDGLARQVIEALERPGDFREIRERARATIVEGYDLRRHCLPTQLKLLQDLMT